MPITVTPIAGLSDHINDIRIRTGRIVNEEILPNEAALWSGRRGEASDEERAAAKALRAKVQARVKSEGLWAPHLPPEYGGMGIDFMAHAYMNEILAYAIGAASLFGVVAPNSGNQTILAKYGTAEQKEKWLLPLVEGTMQSGFSMTEPENAGSDPRSIQTTAVRQGDEWVINGHKWFTSNGLAADFFVVMCRAKESFDDDGPGRPPSSFPLSPARHMTMKKSAANPLEVNHLCPLITHSSPSSTALVRMERGSEPALSGSVMENPDCIVPSMRGRSHFCFCSSVPYLTRMVWLPELGATTPKSAAAPMA